MDFSTVSRICNLLCKPYAENFLTLLAKYQNISASEAASRLNIHIKTAQDFLDELTALDYLKKEAVFEKKRPYFRYSIKNCNININFELYLLYDKNGEDKKIDAKIRERKNSGAVFATSGNNRYLSSVTVFIGEGRKKEERKINLTSRQGKFLFYLPFPSSDFHSIREIMSKASLDTVYTAEILDIVDLLIDHTIIEVRD